MLNSLSYCYPYLRLYDAPLLFFLINDEEFIKRKTELQNQITKAREKLNQTQDRGQNWIELVEKAFNFAVYAGEKFITTKDPRVKREILSALGQRFIR